LSWSAAFSQPHRPRHSWRVLPSLILRRVSSPRPNSCAGALHEAPTQKVHLNFLSALAGRCAVLAGIIGQDIEEEDIVSSKTDTIKERPYTKESAIAWLNEHWQGQTVCPICRNNDWNVSESLVEIRQFLGGLIRSGGSLYPMFLVTCGVCGHTLLFNAVIAGFTLSWPTPDIPPESK